jgi:hypothetical protein
MLGKNCFTFSIKQIFGDYQWYICACHGQDHIGLKGVKRLTKGKQFQNAHPENSKQARRNISGGQVGR